MKTLDLASSFFWLVFSIIVFMGSLHVGIGKLHNPGMGFMTLGASGILGILSLVLFLQALLRKEDQDHEPLFAGKAWKRVVFVLIVLFLYAWLMPIVGYLISTFIGMALLFGVLEKKRIGMVLLCALLSTLITHLIFSKWLNCEFPVGFLGY
jgi:putative tricarboxylic transport membrane protein